MEDVNVESEKDVMMGEMNGMMESGTDVMMDVMVKEEVMMEET